MLESGASSAVDGNRHAFARFDRRSAILIPRGHINAAGTNGLNRFAYGLYSPSYFGLRALLGDLSGLTGYPAEVFKSLIERRSFLRPALCTRRTLFRRRGDEARIGIGQALDDQRRLAGSSRCWSCRNERDERCGQ